MVRSKNAINDPPDFIHQGADNDSEHEGRDRNAVLFHEITEDERHADRERRYSPSL